MADIRNRGTLRLHPDAAIAYDPGTGTLTITVGGVSILTATAASGTLAGGQANIADVSITAVSDLSTSDTYSDAAVNGLKNDIMTEVGVLETAVNGILANLEAAGINLAS